MSLDQLTDDALDHAGDRSLHRIALVTVFNSDSVRSEHEFIDVLRPQRTVKLGEVGRIGRAAAGGRLEDPTHGFSGPEQPREHAACFLGGGVVMPEEIVLCLDVQEVVVAQPLQRGVERVEVVVRAGSEIERVHEVEAVLEPCQVPLLEGKDRAVGLIWLRHL